jgi:mRNA-degrading endonuclease RelE of RelBE toxin-antitoxin system
MPKIEASQRFKNAYRDLPPKYKPKLKRALRLLTENPRHPSLQSKPIQGINGIYEARIDQNYRMTYEPIPANIVRMRTEGKHD